MQRIFSATLCGLMTLFFATCSVAAEPTPTKLNLSVWQHIPVLHHGRIMPLDTFARNASEIICHRVDPTLSLAGISEDDLKSEDFAGAVSLFPDNKPRKFTASELLLSWLSEPEKWEHVPFLIAEHEELRKLLDIPVLAADGTHLKYVSPAEVANSDVLRKRLEQMAQDAESARMNKQSPPLSALDERVKKLYEAFTLYRQITFNPKQQEAARSRFLQTASEVLKGWAKLDEDLTILRAKPELNQQIQRVEAALQALATAAGNGRFPLESVEPSVIIAVDGLNQLSADCNLLKTQIAKAQAGQVPGFDDAQIATAKKRLNRLAAAVRLVTRQATDMHMALYDNGDSLRVVPSLNVAALDKDRDVSDESQPWLTLQTVLFGSPELLKDYPQPQISAVRATFARLATAYSDRTTNNRAQTLVTAQQEFSDAIRVLGNKITAQRDKLEIAGRDEELLNYTAYPEPSFTNAEVTYNQTDPFKWSWVISLLALAAFALAFGVARKPMFWLGMLILGLGLAVSIYGFYLRIMITRWAPVTNMYETVVYVPFFVSALAAWLVLLPLTWPGFSRAWRLTAIPGTWETWDLDQRKQTGEPSSTRLINWIMLLPRVALMGLVLKTLALDPYAAGGRTIINLLPVVDVGSSMPTMNNLVVWFVGLCVLIPAVWFLPRFVLSLVLGVFTITKSLFEQGNKLADQVYVRKSICIAATFAAFLGSFVAWYSPVLDKNFTPLTPILRDNFWLAIHVLTIVSSYGAGMLAWGLGNLALAHYLFGKYRDRPAVASSLATAPGFGAAKHDGVEFEPEPQRGRLAPEACHALSQFIYKSMQVAVLLLAAGTILGGLWADVSWGRFWGWDPKEVWALISLLTYLAILHGRFVGWFGDFGLAVGSVMGATAIIMSWYGVNFVLGAGLHSYGFGAGGQTEVGIAVLANWLFLGAAAIRYRRETSEPVAETKTPDSTAPAKTSSKENVTTKV